MPQRTILHVESPAPSNASSPRLTKTGTGAPEGALAGAGMCVVLIGAIGWLAGIGVLSLPGIDRITAEGPTLAALCGIVAGATVGGIAGCLVGRRIPGNRVSPNPREEKIVISVRARDVRTAARAGRIMNAAGAIPISVPEHHQSRILLPHDALTRAGGPASFGEPEGSRSGVEPERIPFCIVTTTPEKSA